MYPDIVKFGKFGIHSYGLMLALGFFAGLWYIRLRAKEEKLSFELLLNLSYIMIFGGVIGARLGYVLLHLSDFSADPLSAINPFAGDQFGISGLNLYGGVLLAIGAGVTYIKIKKLPMGPVFDLFAPTLGLGLGISRVGCFLNGCCFGNPTDLPWGVTFPPESPAGYIFGSQAVHPTQLYTSGYGLILFFTLNYLLRRKKFDGQILALLFMSEAFFRFIIEFVRYYESEMVIPMAGIDPTYNQIVALLLFAAGLIIYIKSPRRLYRDSSKVTS